jgi:hypothetical protein
MRRSFLLFILTEGKPSERVGAPGMDGFYSDSNDELLEYTGDSWNDHDGHEGEEITTRVPIDESIDENAQSIPTNAIYTCGGTAQGELSFCQFPFTTLAGNEYTNKCADQAEDNPDVSVDRPWCFVSATDWGFCDCSATLDFTHLVAPDTSNKTKADIVVQVTIDYPATIWCYLEGVDAKTSIGLAEVTNGTVAGATTTISAEMILQSIVATVLFPASVHVMQAKPILVCSANCPGLMTQPEPVKIALGTRPDEEETDRTEPDLSKPHLITRTSGSLVYSIVILMLLGSIIGARYALDIREKMMFSILNEVSMDRSQVQYGVPLQVITK